jgi:hypothetical protein
MLTILALGRLRQEGYKYKANSDPVSDKTK